MKPTIQSDVPLADTTTTMRAMVYERFGRPEDVLSMREVAKPVPGPDQVLVRVRASSVNAYDWHVMTGAPYVGRLTVGLFRPKWNIPGADIAGTVETVGEDVTEFAPGDEVFGELAWGGFAEYVTARAAALAPKPSTIELEEASTLGIAALTALQALRDAGRLQPGQRVLINGASGGVGTFAIQIARALGAAQITAVCSTRNVEAARALGADRVIDYTKEDFTKSGDQYDLMFDNVGNRTLAECRSTLATDGVYVAVSGPKHRWLGPIRRIIAAQLLSKVVSQRATFLVAEPNTGDLLFLRELVESGHVKPAMERRYSLEEAVVALQYQGEGHARGKSVIVP